MIERGLRWIAPLLQGRLLKMCKTLLVSALVLATVFAGSVFAAYREPLDAATLNTRRR
jgi:hypothetical protein